MNSKLNERNIAIFGVKPQYDVMGFKRRKVYTRDSSR